MTHMLFDTADASGVRLTRDGYLVGEALVARTGIQLYTAGELGLDGNQSRVLRVYRPEDEVFATDAMASYAHRPVTVDHPSVMVDAANWKEYAKGQTGDEVLRDGEAVRVPMMLMDSEAIRDWSEGKRELSMGYTMDLEVVDGETPDGEHYDAVQRNLRMNHLALVSRARGGSKLRLGDGQSEDSSMSDVKTTTVIVDGLQVVTTESGAQAISKLLKDLETVRSDSKAAAEAHAEALAAKDRELAQKDGQIEKLEEKVLSDADLDKMVNDRADLIAQAKQIADKDYTGMSSAEIRKAAVVAVKGQEAVDGKSDDYILARFDTLSEDAKQDPVRRTMRNGLDHSANGKDKAFNGMVNDLENRWKGEAA